MTTDSIESLLGEHLITLPQAARQLPRFRADRPVHPATILRWVLSGTKAADGQRVRLEGFKTPSGWRTTKEALSRFFATLTPDFSDGEEGKRSSERRSCQRLRDSTRAAAELQKRARI